MDWAFADFLSSVGMLAGTTYLTYLFWASGYLRMLMMAAKRNHWGFGNPPRPPEEWLNG